MKKKINLSELQVKSFVTTIDNAGQIQGGATLPVVCRTGQPVTFDGCFTNTSTQPDYCNPK